MSRFTNPDPIGRYEPDGKNFVLHEPLGYAVGSETSCEIITVPSGFSTDFASIPQCLHSLLPVHIGRRAAIVHDYLYRTKGMGGKYSRKQSDLIFLEALKVLNVPCLLATTLYVGVRIGGWVIWNHSVYGNG